MGFKSYKFYRSKLSSSEQNCYDTILSAFNNYISKVNVYETNYDILNKIVQFVLNDNPLIYYFDSVMFNFYKGKKYTTLKIKYRYSLDEINKLNVVLFEKINIICDSISKYSTYNKIYLIHNMLCSKVSYFESGFKSHSIIGVFFDKKAVCEGIAKAVKVLLDAINVPNVFVYGEGRSQQNSAESDKHSWNKININNKWYNLDVTYDLTLKSSNLIRYDYFLISDKSLYLDHSEKFDYGFICDSDDLTYYNKKKLIMLNQQKLSDFVKKCLKNKIYNFQFKLPNAQNKNEVYKKVMDVVKNVLIELNYHKSFNVSYNVFQLVFSVEIV